MKDYILSEARWHEPLQAGSFLASLNENFTLLYSAKKTGYSGEYSYIAWGKLHQINRDIVEMKQCTNQKTPLPTWFGYLSYEANNAALKIEPCFAETIIPSENICFIQYKNIIKYNHKNQTCHYYGENPSIIENICKHNPDAAEFPAAKNYSSNISYADYLSKINQTIDQIYAGNFYQANITAKFYGELQQELTPQSAFAGFRKLCELSPAPYASFIANDDLFVLSSSPELFIKINDEGEISTRPIKGTVATEAKENLSSNPKTMAENLMIVDLMRNDLSTHAKIGSVKVPAFLEVDNFTNLRHLSSTITAQLVQDFEFTEVLSNIFPAGSMTGAPKIAAMQWISQTEQIKRGIYSGAIGWINGKECELSVVIRTLITRKNKYETQFGGGIIANSDPKSEYEELLIKAKSIFNLLQINPNKQTC
jgi:anthranilate/para-aminobenzoate synthase component I